MVYKFKYKLIKNMLSKYFDLKELNFNVANENTVINISTNDNIFFSLYVNEHEDDFKFNADEKLVNYFSLLNYIFDIANVSEYLLCNEEISIEDKEVCVKITKVIAFGFPALLVGDEDYILAIPLSEDFNNENIEDIAIALLEYSKERAFPECNSKLVITEDFFSRLPEELKKLNFLDIKNRD